ncbi:hypothetical protein BS101_04000 [Clostridium kluyveri]|uniref:Phage-Barnase-EndoU-ColicinE5/D-RelE like nuclease 3 domain-containing protein n=2 Tax=Clostridium kluyveri TaxID=1534 RepID=A0A1L5F4M3_CLOKL|nr:hypothetical protein BS101_04000 [Clostridium kluyveri]
MLNRHGNPNGEARKGQIAITSNDIKQIPNIINNYDYIKKGNLNRKNQTIVYMKDIKGMVYYVEVISESKNTLSSKTMWKKPSVTVNDSTRGTSLTLDVQTTGYSLKL